ncbi:tRNA (cytosine(38)-c(5))-methyltransferase [Plakobranchus ocellatus]|uniref:tRNA (cytosine(38)-C(5))-methyltransferase n=1 Tax=Plakobranchus ocellatus TaxID=259542 RepID=A0AAV4CT18_9GAST|nr:tRNA (cytosine(38)-c(5))-methyltransferase [Plakobranchus ocellatus]
MAASIEQPLRVLELYSGIGGMHWALKESHIDYEIVMAVDINTTANKIYQHNFPHANLLCFGIEKLSLKKFESLKIDAVLMSPPCQPFTRVGKKGDCTDVRTQSFLHLLQLINQMTKKPAYILVENVKGFETSQTRELLLECLSRCGYNYQEFLLTPLQFGIPNCRLRYYLLARHHGSFSFNHSSQILTVIPQVKETCHIPDHYKKRTCNPSENSCYPSDPEVSHLSAHTEHVSNGGKSDFHLLSPETCAPPHHGHENTSSYTPSDLNISTCALTQESGCRDLTQEPNHADADLRDAGRNMRYCEEEDKFVNEHSKFLSEFMEKISEENLDQYLLSDKELRFFVVMDIVFPALKKSVCFTKRYGHYVDGAGSVVQMSTDAQVTREASQFKSLAVRLQNSQEWQEEELSLLRKLRLRYFTPREVANLLGFPEEFAFPAGLSNIQKYRVLGNSLNVHVVATLIKLMVS